MTLSNICRCVMIDRVAFSAAKLSVYGRAASNARLARRESFAPDSAVRRFEHMLYRMDERTVKGTATVLKRQCGGFRDCTALKPSGTQHFVDSDTIMRCPRSSPPKATKKPTWRNPCYRTSPRRLTQYRACQQLPACALFSRPNMIEFRKIALWRLPNPTGHVDDDYSDGNACFLFIRGSGQMGISTNVWSQTLTRQSAASQCRASNRSNSSGR